MNSDTLNLGGERRVPMRKERCRGTAAAVGCPLQPACKGRGLRRGCRCAQPKRARSSQFPIGQRAAAAGQSVAVPGPGTRRSLPSVVDSPAARRGFCPAGRGSGGSSPQAARVPGPHGPTSFGYGLPVLLHLFAVRERDPYRAVRDVIDLRRCTYVSLYHAFNTCASANDSLFYRLLALITEPEKKLIAPPL
jgi:hypothetical protein